MVSIRVPQKKRGRPATGHDPLVPVRLPKKLIRDIGLDPASGRFYNAAVQSLPPYLQEPVRMTGRSCWCLDLFERRRLTARNIDVVECSRLAPAAGSPHRLRCAWRLLASCGMTGTGAFDFAVLGSPTVLRHTD
jgi:hypothetical protein